MELAALLLSSVEIMKLKKQKPEEVGFILMQPGVQLMLSDAFGL